MRHFIQISLVVGFWLMLAGSIFSFHMNHPGLSIMCALIAGFNLYQFLLSEQ